MIFVAVGTQKFQMNRLLRKIDNLISDGLVKEKVFAQIGHSDYIPQNYEYRKFLSKAEFEECVRKCELLITHSGVATIMLGLKSKKTVIVVPRLEKYNEHVDDHQLQIAEAFFKQKFVLMCGEKDDLGEIMAEAKSHMFCEYESNRQNVIKTISDFLDIWSGK